MLEKFKNGFSVIGPSDSIWSGINIWLPYWLETGHEYAFHCQVKSDPLFAQNDGEILFRDIWATNGVFAMTFGSNEAGGGGGTRLGIDENMSEGWQDYAWLYDSKLESSIVHPELFTWRISLQINGWNQYKTDVRNLVVTDLTLKNQIQEILDGTTSLEENSRRQMLLYPNPASAKAGKIFISGANKGTFKIADIQGRVIVDLKLDEDDYMISLPSLEPGIYFVRYTDENGTYSTSRLVIQ